MRSWRGESWTFLPKIKKKKGYFGMVVLVRACRESKNGLHSTFVLSLDCPSL
jgi:hypothetical protein